MRWVDSQRLTSPKTHPINTPYQPPDCIIPPLNIPINLPSHANIPNHTNPPFNISYRPSQPTLSTLSFTPLNYCRTTWHRCRLPPQKAPLSGPKRSKNSSNNWTSTGSTWRPGWTVGKLRERSYACFCGCFVGIERCRWIASEVTQYEPYEPIPQPNLLVYPTNTTILF